METVKNLKKAINFLFWKVPTYYILHAWSGNLWVPLRPIYEPQI